jgi:hypothetical protein
MLGADEGALMARSPIDEVADVVKDAAYVSVGLGVIAFQRLQVRRNELGKALRGQATAPTGPLGVVSSLVGERLKVVEERLGAALERK